MPSKNNDQAPKEGPAITSITVSGFKSIASEQSIEVRPLTLLAGANSAGKSSMMQAILLLKQTLEASYDPGPLLLNGPNVRFTSAEQLLCHGIGIGDAKGILIRIAQGAENWVELRFGREAGKRLDLTHFTLTEPDSVFAVDMSHVSDDMIRGKIGESDDMIRRKIRETLPSVPDAKILNPQALRNRCFIELTWNMGNPNIPVSVSVADAYRTRLLDVIHLPGLRGNPERAYPLTATGPEFPGTFEKYTAGVVAQWSHSSQERLHELGEDLQTLGLTWKVKAEELDDTRIELRVGRLPKPKKGGAHDLVNIADVGFGASQTLPVLVALLVARPGQLLYIEQPEIHLHPRAQIAMASLLAKAANRGVHVVAETHSSLLLLGVQSLVAEKRLAPDKVKLHWFTRSDTNGTTTVTSADLDEAGRFGDWPEDFDDVTLHAQKEYLDAAEERLAAK
jgi:predicted ATPase